MDEQGNGQKYAALVDSVLVQLEAAAERLRAASGSIVSLPSAELNLLHHLEAFRDLVLEALQSSKDRTVLIATFGGEGVRLARARAVLDNVHLSDVGAKDLRWSSCLAACDSAEQVLADLGLLRRPLPLAAQTVKDEAMLLLAPRRNELTNLNQVCPAGAEHLIEELAPSPLAACFDDSGESSDEDNCVERQASTALDRRLQDAMILDRQHRLLGQYANGPGNTAVSKQQLGSRRWSAASESSELAFIAALAGCRGDGRTASQPSSKCSSRLGSKDLEQELPSEVMLAHHLEAARKAEDAAVHADQDGDYLVAAKRYTKACRFLAAALETLPPGSDERRKLTRHRQQVLRRRKYLRGLLPTECNPEVLPVDVHIQPLSMPVPVQAVKSVAGEACDGANDECAWQSLAACAAIGAAGGFIVLGSTIAVTAGVVGSAAGAAAGVYCASRKDVVSDAAYRIGSAAIAKAEEARQAGGQHLASLASLGGIVSLNLPIADHEASAPPKGKPPTTSSSTATRRSRSTSFLSSILGGCSSPSTPSTSPATAASSMRRTASLPTPERSPLLSGSETPQRTRKRSPSRRKSVGDGGDSDTVGKTRRKKSVVAKEEKKRRRGSAPAGGVVGEDHNSSGEHSTLALKFSAGHAPPPPSLAAPPPPVFWSEYR